jgi:hypothetical protein
MEQRRLLARTRADCPTGSGYRARRTARSDSLARLRSKKEPDYDIASRSSIRRRAQSPTNADEER